MWIFDCVCVCVCVSKLQYLELPRKSYKNHGKKCKHFIKIVYVLGHNFDLTNGMWNVCNACPSKDINLGVRMFYYLIYKNTKPPTTFHNFNSNFIYKIHIFLRPSSIISFSTFSLLTNSANKTKYVHFIYYIHKIAK